MPEAKSGTRASRAVDKTSNLLDELVKARRDEHRSVSNLAKMSSLSAAAIRTMERGRGPVATLVAVMEALPFHVTGLASGDTFAEQLRNRRLKRGMSIDDLAGKASVPSKDIEELEGGAGMVSSLLRVLAVMAPRISRRAPERAYWGLERKAGRDRRLTPIRFLIPFVEAFGEVDLDPCGHPDSPVAARRRFLLSEGDDGLRDPWFGRLVFMNPPFSALLDWLRRAYDQWSSGAVETVVCLVPVRTDSDFFQDVVRLNADIFLLRGRLPFVDESGKSSSTPYSLMVVAFGASARQKALFAERVSGFWM